MSHLSTDDVSAILQGFCNSKDSDIENFLRTKAIEYENRHWCSTYIIVDDSSGKIRIEGYFTLSNKVLNLDPCISKTKKKKLLNGLSSDTSHVPVILIGQLGKYIDDDNCEKSSITMSEILDFAFEIIDEVSERIVCRCILLECREASVNDADGIKQSRLHLHKKYRDYGFTELQKNGDLIQYIITI